MSFKTQRRKILKFIAPIFVLLGMVYLTWIYSYHICWKEIHQHHSPSVGIGLIVGEIVILLIIYFIWFQIHILGPGIQPTVPLYRLIKDERNDYRSITPPLIFSCDSNGFPIWCSSCQSIKIDRSHHSSDMGRCVARFDHYCSWIGCVIGKRNYRLFFQFTVWYLVYFLYVGISSAVYAPIIHKRHGELNGNIIVLFIQSIGWMIMLIALIGSHIYYIVKNISSVDDIAAKRRRRSRELHDEYVNLRYNNMRYVIRINPDTSSIWNKGFKSNWTEIMGSSALFWMIPIGSPICNFGDSSSDDYYEIIGDYKETMSDSGLNSLVDKVLSGDYISEVPI